MTRKRFVKIFELRLFKEKTSLYSSYSVISLFVSRLLVMIQQ